MADRQLPWEQRTHTSFGQPFGGIAQVAYVVEDLHEGMREFARRLRIGPWFYAEVYEVMDARYRGQPTDMRMGLALAFSGSMCFELIHMVDDKPSVYRDFVQRRGYGFHHLGLATREYDAEVERYRAMGYEVEFTGRTPRGIRFGYLDTSDRLPGMLELIEFNEQQERFYSQIQRASQDWDGTDPFRPLTALAAVR
jgi:hypothetical protein